MTYSLLLADNVGFWASLGLIPVIIVSAISYLCFLEIQKRWENLDDFLDLPQWQMERRRVKYSLRIFFAALAIAVTGYSIPAPDYAVEVQYRDRRVLEPMPYKTLFDECMWHASRSDNERIQICHRQASEQQDRQLALLGRRLQIQYRDRTITRRVPHSYAELFTNCQGQYSVEAREAGAEGQRVVDGRIIRNQRIELCHRLAQEQATRELQESR